MMCARMVYILLFFVHYLSAPVSGQSSPLCPAGIEPPSLVSTSFWTRANSFRLGDVDLTAQGWSRSVADRDHFQVLLSRETNKQCPIGTCLLKLSSNRRLGDGMVLLQENVLGTPAGYVDMRDDFFCARVLGDCGADVPIYHWTARRSDNTTLHAYSLDPNPPKLLLGYKRLDRPVCYGWPDGGSYVAAESTDQQCLRLAAIANGRVTYSDTDGAAFRVGSTATLVCAQGHAVSGQTEVLCTRTGWYPASGLGRCLPPAEQSNNVNVLALSPPGSLNNYVTAATTGCPALASKGDGRVLYSTTIGNDQRYAPDTVATIICNLNLIADPEPTATCASNGQWSVSELQCNSADSRRCQPFAKDPQGKISYLSGKRGTFDYGAMAQLICNPGYDVQGSAHSSCEPGGWQPTLGVCERNTPLLVGAATSNSSSVARSKRQIGYVGGICAPPALPLNGIISYLQSNLFLLNSAGTQATLLCNAGFTPTGSASSVCMNGQWQPTLGTCTAVGLPGNSLTQCLAQPFVFNGQIVYSTGSQLGPFPTGSTATLLCNAGYGVSGQPVATCQQGIWSPGQLGVCLQAEPAAYTTGAPPPSITCPTLSVTNGDVTYSSGSTSVDKPLGTVATLFCGLGTTMSGPSSSTCTSSGTWSPPIGACALAGLSMPSVSLPGPSCVFGLLPGWGGTVRYSTGPALLGPFPSGTTAYMTCPTGQAVSGPGTSVCSSGIWQPSGFGSCQMAMYDNALPPPATTGVSGTSSAEPPSYPTESSNSSTQPAASVCYFGVPGVFNGYMQYSTGSNVGPWPTGTVAIMSCNPGYQAQGSIESVCIEGQWNPTVLGVCQIGNSPASTSTSSSSTANAGVPTSAMCWAAPAVFGGMINYNQGTQPFGPFPAGTYATLTCAAGQPSGPALSECVNGVWQPSWGVCQLGAVAAVALPSSTQQSKASSSAATQYEDQLNCPALQFPDNGEITYSKPSIAAGIYPRGARAVLLCAVGYRTEGPASVECRGGLFQPLLGTCVLSKQQSNVQQIEVAPGTTVIRPASHSGSSSSSSAAGVRSQSPSTASKSSIRCSPISAPQHGRITYIQSGRDANYETGTTALLYCDSGYAVNGQTSVVCGSGIWGPSPGLGLCERISRQNGRRRRR